MVELTSALAGPIAALILKSWLGESGAEIGGNLLKLAFARLGDRSKARAALRRAQTIAEAVVDDLGGFFAREGADLEQLEVAAFELGQTIQSNVDAAFLIHKKLKNEDIEQGLLAARPVDTIYSPAEPERGLYISLVRALAPRLRALAPELPDFGLERDAALLHDMAKVAEDTPRILGELNSVREQTARTAATVEEFADREKQQRSDYEAIYRNAIVNVLDYVEILGLDIETTRRVVKLSIAYLSLTIKTAHLGKMDYETLFAMLPLLGGRLLIEGAAGSGKSTLLRWTAVQAAKGEEVENNKAKFDFVFSNSDVVKYFEIKTFQSSAYTEVFFRKFEDLLNEYKTENRPFDGKSSKFITAKDYKRYLFSSEWHKYKLPFDTLRKRIPFLIQLRRLKDGLPRPDDLATHLSSAPGQPPENWVRDLLREGSAVLLIDGVDEVPEGAARNAVLQSVEEYVKLYSDCPVILASRPRAFDKTRLRELGFVEAEVDDLTPEQREGFIDSWHHALAANLGRPTNEREIMGAARNLKRALERQPQIALLATNPLLCAGICALHERGAATLPKDEWDLCERLTHMLVDRRDRSHGRQASVRMEEFGPVYLLPYSDKRSILARIAEAMVSQQLSSLPRDEALDHVRKGLRELRSAETLTPEAVLGALEARSGVLRGAGSVDGHAQRHGGGPETAAPRDAVEFVHNTLKSWLAALHSLDANKPRELAARALVSGYDEVIAFAAAAPGHLSYAKTLIECLLRDAERADASVRRSLLILAMRCDAAATNLPEALRVRVKALQDMLFPPKSLDEAQQLATLGDAAVSNLLPRPNMTDAEAAACTRCLRLIGTEQAWSGLDAYRGTRTIEVLEELALAINPLTLPAVLEEAQGDWRLPASIKQKINDLAPLIGQHDLRTLDLSDTQVGDTGVQHLVSLTGLESLNLSGTRVGDTGVQHLVSLTGLESLNLSSTGVGDAGMGHLAELVNLRFLRLADTRVGDVGVEYLAKLSKLKLLELQGTRISDAILEDLANLDLGVLHLGRTQVGDAGVEHLPKRKSLKFLDLGDTKVGDVGIEHVGKLSNLEILQLQGTRVTDAGLEHLRRLVGLAVLRLSGTKVGDNGLANLAKLAHLAILDLGRTSVGNAGLKHLAKLTRLKFLDLTGTQVGDSGLGHLAKLAQLETLHLEGTRVSMQGVQRLRTQLPQAIVLPPLDAISDS